MQDTARILVVDDEKDHAEAASEALRRIGYHVDTVYTSADALDALEQGPYDVVVTDLKLDGADGLAILREARKQSSGTQVIVLTGYPTVNSAVEAMQAGALTYLEKGAGLNITELRTVVKKAVERSLATKPRRTGDTWHLEGVIGESPSMRRLTRLVRAVAPTTATILIEGESGTGKELIAQAIHAGSPRASKPFVALNCAALSEGILESELFGHEKGSFTGALSGRKGRFEYADAGTLFLDEVGDMPLSTQVKLLRVLEYGEVFRVGSNEPIKVDVRLVAATNRQLEELIRNERFREDLYFRLKVVTLCLPPLREHREDIPLLVAAFLDEFSRTHGRKISGITPRACDILMRYRWPGNIRELKNCIESMVVVSPGGVLDVDDIPLHVHSGTQLALAAPKTAVPEAGALAGMTIKDAERKLIRSTLEETGGNRAEAAKMLGIGERTLYRKLDEYGLR
ncbi:MAG: sigma-54-dependent Fis family transcriptional regulator [Planctomycetes bacterium]|nr:sigma-54-dependent Fis family transcriptional regulator [Planctomycetota bacterium]